MEKKYDVFISYAHEDADIEGRIEAALRGAGLDVFVDNRNISGGDNWLATIAGAIQESCIFLALVSRAYCASSYSKRELNLAIMGHDEGGLRVIPYMIDNGLMDDAPADMKMLIGSLQWVTIDKYPIGDSLVKLLKDTLRGGFVRKEMAAAVPKVLETYCFYHPDRGVAGRCIDCGKNLCKECVAKYETVGGEKISVCVDCADKRNKVAEIAKKELKKSMDEERSGKRESFFIKLVISLAIGIALFLILILNEIDVAWVYVVAAMISFIPFGFVTAASTADPRNHPENNPGCFLQLIIGVFAGIFLFFRDLIDILGDGGSNNEQ